MLEFILEIKSYSSHAYNVLKPPFPHGEDAYIAPKPPLPRGEDAYNDDEFSHFIDDEEFEGFNKNEDPEDPDEFYSEPKAKKQDKVTPSPSPSSQGGCLQYNLLLSTVYTLHYMVKVSDGGYASNAMQCQSKIVAFLGTLINISTYYMKI